MKYILLFAVLLNYNLASAHGEDKPGPNGGHIRMPGAFHTEVVSTQNGYKIYLLDIEWKNPTTKNSFIQASVVSGKKTAALSCKQEVNHFFCESKLPQKGKLEIQATREGQKGNLASYSLPLKFEATSKKTAPVNDHHMGH